MPNPYSQGMAKGRLPLNCCIRTSHAELRKDVMLRAPLWALMVQSPQGNRRGICIVMWWERPPKYLLSTLLGTADPRVFSGFASWDQPEVRPSRR